MTYSRELVATRTGGTSYDGDPAVFTYFGIRRAKADGSTILVNLSRITLENYGGSTFDEKNFMTWGGTYYPIGSTWTVTKDNYNVKTHVDDMGMDLPVWQSSTMGNWDMTKRMTIVVLLSAIPVTTPSRITSSATTPLKRSQIEKQARQDQ